MLAKLCTVEDNSDILYTNLKKTVYARLCESLLLADVEVRRTYSIVTGWCIQGANQDKFVLIH